MNTFNLSRNWFNFVYENPKRVRAVHTAVYFFILDVHNRSGRREIFPISIPTLMSVISVHDKHTIYSVIDDLVEFGVLKIHQKGKNQFHPTLMSIIETQKRVSPLDRAFLQMQKMPVVNFTQQPITDSDIIEDLKKSLCEKTHQHEKMVCEKDNHQMVVGKTTQHDSLDRMNAEDENLVLCEKDNQQPEMVVGNFTQQEKWCVKKTYGNPHSTPEKHHINIINNNNTSNPKKPKKIYKNNSSNNLETLHSSLWGLMGPLDSFASQVAFYDSEIHAAESTAKNGSRKIVDRYVSFVKYLFGGNGNPLNCPSEHVLSIKKQLTYSEYCQVSDLAEERRKEVKDVLNYILNTPASTKGKLSLFLTLENAITR